MNHEHFMRRAFHLAQRGRGYTSPNPMVGCVIIKNGKIIAEGWHKKLGGDHAEIDALKKIGMKANGATMYVTLEPCSHFGRTPPCVDQVIASGIKEIFIGMKDPNPINNGKSIQRLRRAHIQVNLGCLENELRELNEVFIKYISLKLPFVTTKCAQTLDGKIATRTGESKWITSRESRECAHKLRGEFDAILVGINTVLKDNPFLNPTGTQKRLKKIIVDSRLRIPLNARLFQGMRKDEVIVATTNRASGAKIKVLQNKAAVIICPIKNGRITLRWLFKELAKKEISNILIEGGGQIIGSALNEKLVDKMLIFIAPQIAGDQQAVGSISGRTVKKLNEMINLKGIKIRQMSEDIVVEGYVHGNY